MTHPFEVHTHCRDTCRHCLAMSMKLNSHVNETQFSNFNNDHWQARMRRYLALCGRSTVQHTPQHTVQCRKQTPALCALQIGDLR